MAPASILLKLKLPKADWMEFLREIKEDPKFRAIPVITLTAPAEDRDVMEAYELG